MDALFLKGEKVSLRPLVKEDATYEYANWLNDKDTCLGNSHHVYPNTLINTLKFIESSSTDKSAIHLAIIANDKDKHIGNVSLKNINLINRSAEFAILIGDKSYWNKGVGFDALVLVIRHGFSNLNLHTIQCGTFSNNNGMQSLALKLGMKKAGIFREAVFKENKYLDIIQYDILQKEFKF